MQDIKKVTHIHFVGIKGVGMAALALCAQDLGIRITGSDTEEVFVTDETLKLRGIFWEVGFRKENLQAGLDLVITTAAHGGFENPEVLAANELGIPVLSHAEALARFMQGKDGIVTAGVGGKSTTAAMIAHVLDFAGRNPSFAIGVGNIPSLGVPGRYDKNGREFVTEGDEFLSRFHQLSPKIAVLTNIEHDHPDVYPTLEDMLASFKTFVQKVPSDGLLVANLGNENIRRLLKGVSVPTQTFGASDADWKEENIKLQLPGKYNALNALAAFVVANHLGISARTIKETLGGFQGTKRRFEKVGEVGGVLVYDDYAHHPAEIKAVIKAAREWFPERRLIAVFQPHTYSRTKALFSEFAKSLALADVVTVMDIYSSAREKPDPEISSEKLTNETLKYTKNAFYTKGHESTLEWLIKNSKSGNLILTLGAGDIFYIHKELMARL